MAKKTEKIKLWSPLTVGFSALALTYPVGALLAATNANRLGDTEEKKKYVRYGVLYIILFIIFGYFTLGEGLTTLGGIINIFMAYRLFSETKTALENHSKKDSIVHEPWWKALLIGIGVFVAAGLFYLLFAVLMMTFNSQ